MTDMPFNEPSSDLQPPGDAWESFKSFFRKADQIIRETRNNELIGLWLDRVIHNMIWHDADCVVRWICENKELVRKLNEIERHADFEALRPELNRSIESLKRY